MHPHSLPPSLLHSLTHTYRWPQWRGSCAPSPSPPCPRWSSPWPWTWPALGSRKPHSLSYTHTHTRLAHVKRVSEWDSRWDSEWVSEVRAYLDNSWSIMSEFEGKKWVRRRQDNSETNHKSARWSWWMSEWVRKWVSESVSKKEQHSGSCSNQSRLRDTQPQLFIHIFTS